MKTITPRLVASLARVAMGEGHAIPKDDLDRLFGLNLCAMIAAKVREGSPAIVMSIGLSERGVAMLRARGHKAEIAAATLARLVSSGFNAAGTVSGRLSSSAPNLQTLPPRSDTARKVGAALAAGRMMLPPSIDFGDLEHRLAAAFGWSAP